MAIVKIFCFWCSVRLGCLIIAILSLIQACVDLISSIVYWDHLKEVSEFLNRILITLRIDYSILKYLADSPRLLVICFMIFSISFLFTCILLIFGTIQCKWGYVCPFIFFYGFYVIFMLIVLIICIMFLKANNHGLGDVILYSNLGGFIWLFYLYTWICVYSFIQIIRELQQRLNIKIRAVESLKPRKNIKVIRRKY